jgi:hypothetical protein
MVRTLAVGTRTFAAARASPPLAAKLGPPRSLTVASRAPLTFSAPFSDAVCGDEAALTKRCSRGS